MSRNTNRRVPQSGPSQPAELESSAGTNIVPPSNPFGLSYVVPSEIVHLPSKGLFYDKASPLYGVEKVEIKSMTSHEEDILVNQSFIEEGIVFERLLEAIILSPTIRPSELLECDQAALLAAARKTGYGDELGVNQACNACGMTSPYKVKISDMLEKNKNKDLDKNIAESSQVTKTAEGYLQFQLSKTSLTVTMRTMTPEDYEYLLKSKMQKSKLNLPFNETVEFIRRVIVDVNRVTDRLQINQLIEVLPARDARFVKLAHISSTPRFDTSYDFICPHCNEESVEEVPFSVGWFWWD